MKIKRSVEVALSALLSLSILTGCAQSPEEQDVKFCYEITEGELSEEDVASILGADTSYINNGFGNGDYVRTLVTKDKPIYIVPTQNYLNWSKNSVKDLVEELNTVFEMINPDVKFIYQETMPDESYNVITIDVSDKIDSTGVAEMRRFVKNGGDVYNLDCKITVHRDYWYVNFFVELDTLLAHEVGHVLGLGHLSEESETNSVMIHYGTSGPNGYYTLNDMYLFATLYGGYSNKEEVLQAKQKIDNYYKECLEKKFSLPILPNFSNNNLPNNFSGTLPHLNNGTWKEKVSGNNNNTFGNNWYSPGLEK